MAGGDGVSQMWYTHTPGVENFQADGETATERVKEKSEELHDRDVAHFLSVRAGDHYRTLLTVG